MIHEAIDLTIWAHPFFLAFFKYLLSKRNMIRTIWVSSSTIICLLSLGVSLFFSFFLLRNDPSTSYVDQPKNGLSYISMRFLASSVFIGLGSMRRFWAYLLGSRTNGHSAISVVSSWANFFKYILT